jgi:hypothetical protein
VLHKNDPRPNNKDDCKGYVPSFWGNLVEKGEDIEMERGLRGCRCFHETGNFRLAT